MAAKSNAPGERTYFEQQRDLLIGDVAAVSILRDTPPSDSDNTQQSLETVLQNLNKLNRSLEGVIAVCLLTPR